MYFKKTMRKHWNNLKKVKKVIDFSKISQSKSKIKKSKNLKIFCKDLKKENKNLISKIKSIQGKRELSNRISFRNLKKKKKKKKNKINF